MYKQIKVTAIGPKNSCIHADDDVAMIDFTVIEGERTLEQRPLLWARFTDVIYIQWTHGQELLEVFHEWLNNRSSGIKFTKQ